ncbi:hypothetical protein [Mucilaginibacter ginkgonis]|uniref:2TM domain-containing protein n=1 Tax=Mucilaginibacter ginkgonis TaxID=2682091 RepID=A0A6I4HZ59_9SPHI|nr:hypothetical protein [Mucilaginibacter ginkgonis]QQL50118.1 hypothetical protein GO620_001315 [Mucilaginibacter ginkgonis]
MSYLANVALIILVTATYMAIGKHSFISYALFYGSYLMIYQGINYWIRGNRQANEDFTDYDRALNSFAKDKFG